MTQAPSQHPPVQPWVRIPPPSFKLPSKEQIAKIKPLGLVDQHLDPRHDFRSIEGEYFDKEEQLLFLYGRNKDGIYHRFPRNYMTQRYGALVRDYDSRKLRGLTKGFDPSAPNVAPDSRVRAQSKPSKRSKYTESDEDESDSRQSEDFINDVDEEDNPALRRSTRTATIKSRQRSPSFDKFSPRKTRSRTAKGHLDDDQDFESSEDIDDDDDDDFLAKPIKGKSAKQRTRRTIQPAYGLVRGIEDLYDSDEETAPLRAHRNYCEKCQKQPAHLLIAKFKKKGNSKRKKARKDEDESSGDEGEKLANLGGWVRCLKCCVSAHWQCLAGTQRDDILRAARARAPNADKRTYLEALESTEFICGACSKGGICMACNDVVLTPADTSSKRDSDEDVDMLNSQNERHTSAIETAPSSENLFRCTSCKRLSHYAHLPNPGGNNSELGVIDLALHYQVENAWKCADCVSFADKVDQVLAWRPYPPNATEKPLGEDELPNIKESLPREYLVKWTGRSYRRAQWVPHMWLLSTHQSKLKNFVHRGPRVQLLKTHRKPADIGSSSRASSSTGRSTPVMEGVVDLPAMEDDVVHLSDNESEGPPPADPQATRRIPLDWLTVDRLLDVYLWNPGAKRRKNGNKGKSVRKRNVIGSEEEADELDDLDMEAENERILAFDKGIKPNDVNLETLVEWEQRVGRELTVDDIGDIVWCYFKYEDLAYEESTWDSPPRAGEQGYAEFQSAFNRFLAAQKVEIKLVTGEALDKRNSSKTPWPKQDQPPDLGQDQKYKLMDFQLDGVNWLLHHYWTKQPAILADDMGLGKTVQLITAMGVLFQKFQVAPFLVVVPNSTVTNWVRELERWAPALRVVPFFGEQKSRDIIRKFELRHENVTKGTAGLKFHVLLTTYDTITSAKESSAVFKSVKRWEGLIVDEGQRLKSDGSLLFKKLNELPVKYRILMTGTPLNNNIRELLNLMNFLDPDSDQWQDLEALSQEYEVLTEERVTELHEKLKPYFLRRTKAQVLKLPPKNEVILPLSMTPIQKMVYREILKHNVSLLKTLSRHISAETTSKTSSTNLRNMLMQLRKCLQHPYLVEKNLEERGLPRATLHKGLVEAGAKFLLLQNLLPILKKRGHRVLLFSQFVIALDIIEDFLQEERYKFLRMDGNTKQSQRQKDMDLFNKSDSDYFIYMLSTRAGGVGINLWSADTVIIFDPDFNPHQDLQAIARAHRFGQQKPVLVIRLMVKSSAEERIMQTGKKKMMLDHVIVQTMDTDSAGSGDLESILTYGAKALFEDDTTTDITYTENDLEQLVIKLETDDGTEEKEEKGALNFGFAQVWERSKGEMEEVTEGDNGLVTQDYWSTLLAQVEAQNALGDTAEKTGRGAKRRATKKPQVYVFEDDKSPEKRPKAKKGKSTPAVSDAESAYADEVSDNSSGVDMTEVRREIMDLSLAGPDSIAPLADPGTGISDAPTAFKPSVPFTTPAVTFLSPPPKPRPKKKRPAKSFAPQGFNPMDFGSTSVAPSLSQAQYVCSLCHRIHGSGQCSVADNLNQLLKLREQALAMRFDDPRDREETLATIDSNIQAAQQAGRDMQNNSSTSIVKQASGSKSSGKRPAASDPSTLPKPKKPKPTVGPLLTPIPLAAPSATQAHITVPSAPQARTGVSNAPAASGAKPPNQFPRCPICMRRPTHGIWGCPVVQAGSQSIERECRRLAKEGGHDHLIMQLHAARNHIAAGTIPTLVDSRPGPSTHSTPR